MEVALIAAMARNGVIGRQGRVPWHLPEDLARFKRLTMGHALVMGRKTFESIGHALPGRRTIVVTRRPGWTASGVDVASSIDDALTRAGDATVFVAGGAEVYRETLDRAARLHLTVIDRDIEGDAFFPRVDPSAFRVVAREAHPDGDLPYEFLTLERIAPKE